MAKKDLKNAIRKEKDKKEVIEEVEEKPVKVKPVKKKMTAHEKRKLIFKIFGWIMAISMIFGSIMSIIYPLIGR